MTQGVQIRLDARLKKDSEKVFADIGLDMPTAIRIFLKKVVKEQKIPFELSAQKLTVNGFTPEFEAEVLRASKEKKIKGPFKDMEAMLQSLKKGKP